MCQLPDKIIIGMVTEAAFRGKTTKNPFNFHHCNIIEASLIVNDVHEPEGYYKADISNDDYINMNSDFLEYTGISTDDIDFDITTEDYLGGNFLNVLMEVMTRATNFIGMIQAEETYS